MLIDWHSVIREDMTKMWMKEMFGTDKPVIGLVHLHAMPTDPKYDAQSGVEGVLEAARFDLNALQEGGIDGVLFCNEFSIPYTPNVRTVTVACMARIIGELKASIRVPFGVCVASDAEKGFDLAAAVGADFIREVLHGAFAGVYGMKNISCGDVERHRYEVGCKDIKTMTAVIPEGCEQLAKRPLKEVVKTLTFNLDPDTLLVYSSNPGSVIDIDMVKEIKSVSDTPVFASNGVKPETVEEILSVCDGCIVATGIKVDGNFYNPIDVERVKQLMINANKVC